MKPIGWSKRSVQLECRSCGSHNRVEFAPYLAALQQAKPLRCSACGAEAVPEDRRRKVAPTTTERRVPVHA